MRGIDNIDNGGSVNYSETEHVIGTWIDGSTLYEKTIDCGNMPNATSKSVNHNISNLKYVVSIDGFMFDTLNRCYSLPYVDISTIANQIYLSANSTTLNIATGANQSVFKGYVTLRYTKTA